MDDDTAQHVSLRAYARRRGVALAAVQYAIKTGHVTAVSRDETGKLIGIHPVLADAQWAANTDPEAAYTHGHYTLAGMPARPPDLVDRAETEQRSDSPEYQESRAKREQYQAELYRLELLTKLGQVGSLVSFQRAMADLAQLTQDRILQVPSRISVALAVETDPLKLETLLTRELKDALDGIAQRAAELAKPAGGPG